MAQTQEEFSVEEFSYNELSSSKGANQIHWSMRLMSLISLFALAIYSYVLWLCQRSARSSNPAYAKSRVRMAVTAFGLDLLISAYFSAITPTLLERGGLHLDRKNMPRPLFWFFAITGFVPTASMSLTVVGGHYWGKRIREKRGWRSFHIVTALVAYFSWWIACAPVFVISVLGEEKVLEWAKRRGLLKG